MNMSLELLFLVLYWGGVGLCVGSFLGVVIDRIPRGDSIIGGRSHCDFCRRNLRWFELVPILSFVLQQGKCLRCKGKLSWRYPSYELISGVIFMILAHTLGFSWAPLVFASLVASSFLVIFIVDLDHMVIPDIFLWVASIGIALYHLTSKGIAFLPTLLFEHGLSGLGASVVLYGLWRVTRKKGLGFGDVLLVFVIGLLVGFPDIIMSVYLGFLTGALIAIILLLQRKKGMKSAIPFGPFLIIGMILALCIDTKAIITYLL
jgi:leader peptidase (prepilin peptidase)/N-methyltransferase